MDLETVGLILDIVSKTVSVLILFVGFLNHFFDYKFNQKMSEFQNTKKNRCSSRKGKQR